MPTHGFRGIGEPFPSSNDDRSKLIRAMQELQENLPEGYEHVCPKCGEPLLGFSDYYCKAECLKCGWAKRAVSPRALSKILEHCHKKDQPA